MKRLEKLNNLTRYLTSFRVPGTDVVPVRVVNYDQAVGRLTHRKGLVILVARPEMSQSGNEDDYTTRFSTAFFVLEKNLGAASTDEREDELFSRCVNVASDLLTEIERASTDWGCEELRGLRLESVEIVPEMSVFGGWSGYSIELAFV